jgi:energy-coupling factor transport system permease protein
MQRAKSLIPLLVPLFVSAFRRADELAIAMEARGYRGGQGRTKFRELRFGRIDAVAMVLSVAFTVLVGVLF